MPFAGGGYERGVREFGGGLFDRRVHGLVVWGFEKASEAAKDERETRIPEIPAKSGHQCDKAVLVTRSTLSGRIGFALLPDDGAESSCLHRDAGAAEGFFVEAEFVIGCPVGNKRATHGARDEADRGFSCRNGAARPPGATRPPARERKRADGVWSITSSSPRPAMLDWPTRRWRSRGGRLVSPSFCPSAATAASMT